MNDTYKNVGSRYIYPKISRGLPPDSSKPFCVHIVSHANSP